MGGVSNARKLRKSYLAARTICDQVGRVSGKQVWLDSMYNTWGFGDPLAGLLVAIGNSIEMGAAEPPY